ncbi:ribosome small subunit-dependent GTPase A [Yoonia sp. 208BN28-4]|uniref:ribosome small subunit-dependent GTPase A n=1 Tax=Yoonia sp. 208BN28-4 TaxID=3126505 RepID=UPI0030ACB522
MTNDITLQDLGWSAHYQSQLDIDEVGTTTPARINGVHRTQIAGLTTDGAVDLTLEPGMSTAEIAVGDWVLCDPKEARMIRRLDRKSTLQRGSDYVHGERQLIASNIDTLFIMTSCNADFNVARLERYLALAHDAEITPVIVITKADQTDDPDHYISQAQALGRDLEVIAIDGRNVGDALDPWCGKGQTVALAGSSGVGKTTLANALTGGEAATQGIREDDARGRHTTTGRSLHRLPSGGWLIDTPGMRGLGVADVAYGINATFPEISELVDQCKFRDCKHEGEPGCAVQAAVAAGDIDPDRLKRFRKLIREDMIATETLAQSRERQKKFGKMVKSAMSKKRR